MSIRATGRLLGVDKDTANHGLPILGQHCQSVMNYFFRNLHLLECQLDELWTFIHKKEDRPDLAGETGGSLRGCLGLDCLQPGVQTGARLGGRKRTLRHARRLLFRLQSATDGHIPFFPSEALPHYADALLEVYGVWGTPPRQGHVGVCLNPRRDPPPDLCYAIVIKERAHGRVVQVTTRIVYGTTVQVEAAWRASPVSHTINTYGVERNNLTIRQHTRRMGRKVNAFSKAPDCLEHQLTVAFAYYHFVVPHRGLRQRLAARCPPKGTKGPIRNGNQ